LNGLVEGSLRRRIPDINARFADENFLHWQVAFPGIWRDWEAAELNGGFDAVIGNPPYVRHELIKLIKPALKRNYPKTYDGTADLYVYFFDQGLKLLKPGGRLSYVVTDIGRASLCSCQELLPPEYAGLRGEGSTPDPLPPPASHLYYRDNLGAGKLRAISEG